LRFEPGYTSRNEPTGAFTKEVTMLEEKDKIPLFAVPDETGRLRKFDDLTGPKGLVLYFYPKDSTPGCTLEAQAFRDHLAAFGKLGFAVAGVSKDSQKSHCSFIEKQGLPFPLLSDTEGKLCEAFGAWGEKVNYGKKYMGIVRSTFLIGKDGRVLKVYPKVSVKAHADKVLADVGSL
jgi:thioredoxin-dependent peroxiredoxin